MSAQNLTLLTDLYELTMMQGYFETQENQTVIFDVFFRENPNKGGYSIMAGVDQVIDYIKNLNFSYEDVDYLRGLGLFSEACLMKTFWIILQVFILRGIFMRFRKEV